MQVHNTAGPNSVKNGQQSVFFVAFEKKKQKNAVCSCANQKNVVPLHPQRFKY